MADTNAKENCTPNNNNKLRFLHVKLPAKERFFYWTIWLTSITFPFYTAWKVSSQQQDVLKRDLEPSSWFNSPWLLMKDTNDSEWDYWRSNVVHLTILFITNTVLSLVTRSFIHRDNQHLVILGFTFILQGIVLSPQGLLIVILLISIAYLVITQMKQVVPVWIICIITLFAIHDDSLKLRMFEMANIRNENENLVRLIVMMAVIRIISFSGVYNENTRDISKNTDSHENDNNENLKDDNQRKKQIRNSRSDEDDRVEDENDENPKGRDRNEKSGSRNINDKSSDNETTMNNNIGFHHLLMYSLYIPVCYNGPLISFETFYKDFYTKPKDFPIKTVLRDTLLTIFNIITLEVFFHLVYANTLCMYYNILEKMSVPEAISMFWIHLHIFNIKYFIFYRFSGIFAKLEGVEPPGPPKCIASLYTFVDMWRYFDKGLNTFLLQNIYIPLGGSVKGFLRRTIASFLCFVFVGFWHGADKSLMIWAVTNWLGIVVESLGTSLTRTEMYQKTVWINHPSLHRRLCALGGAFSVFTLIYTNMIFLVGFDPATILLWRVLSVWYWPPLCLFVFYCGNNCSIDASYT